MDLRKYLILSDILASRIYKYIRKFQLFYTRVIYHHIFSKLKLFLQIFKF